MAAFAAVYFIWGSTYLAIAFAIESIPPFLMASGRFLVPGALMCLVARRSGAPKPTVMQWRTAGVVGTCLLLLGNGGVTYSEQYVSSGLVALLVATMPMFMAVFGWLWGISPRPTLLGWLGLAIGFIGVYLLVRPSGAAGTTPTDYTFGSGLALFASFIWAMGSLYSKKHTTVASPLLAVGMQMVCGGALLLLAGILSGELGKLPGMTLTPRSLMAFIYLATIGSVVAFTAYIWLLQVCNPALVGTYAFVNPVVAVFLGALLNNEQINAHTAAGAVLIVAAVAIVIISNAKKIDD